MALLAPPLPPPLLLPPILQLRYTVHTQKLKHIVVPFKYKIVKSKLSVLTNQQQIFLFVVNSLSYKILVVPTVLIEK